MGAALFVLRRQDIFRKAASSTLVCAPLIARTHPEIIMMKGEIAMNEGRVRTSIDLRAPGKACGHIFVPISTDASAYGSVPIPIIVLGGVSGPTVLLTGGVHGDEYEGPIVLARLGRNLEAGNVAGRLFIVPALNLPALYAGRRTSPLDGLNLNRVFPGRLEGTATEMIADFVTATLLPECDVLIDLHSGGRSLLYTPLAATHLSGDAVRDRRAIDALLSFGAPYALIARDLDSHGLLDHTAEAMGKLVVSTELGGGGIVSCEAIRIGERGVRGVLSHLGVLEPDHEQPPPGPSQLLEVASFDAFAIAMTRGVYEPIVDLGVGVIAGQVLGVVHSFEGDDTPPRAVAAAASGVLICRRAEGITQTGDCVGIIAEKVPG
jgi:predicted deacylase